jgi:hypothetical protein
VRETAQHVPSDAIVTSHFDHFLTSVPDLFRAMAVLRPAVAEPTAEMICCATSYANRLGVPRNDADVFGGTFSTRFRAPPHQRGQSGTVVVYEGSNETMRRLPWPMFLDLVRRTRDRLPAREVVALHDKRNPSGSIAGVWMEPDGPGC